MNVILPVVKFYVVSVNRSVVGNIADKELAVIVTDKGVVNLTPAVVIGYGENIAVFEPARIIAEILVAVAVGLEFARFILVEHAADARGEGNTVYGICKQSIGHFQTDAHTVDFVGVVAYLPRYAVLLVIEDDILTFDKSVAV